MGSLRTRIQELLMKKALSAIYYSAKLLTVKTNWKTQKTRKSWKARVSWKSRKTRKSQKIRKSWIYVFIILYCLSYFYEIYAWGLSNWNSMKTINFLTLNATETIKIWSKTLSILGIGQNQELRNLEKFHFFLLNHIV